ncbi:MAG TPA: hypothetical protein VFH27_16950 [Longimicrobiaceae bacterium]|nr:hypothetical protein [Longimicrobiaceae bacterium]
MPLEAAAQSVRGFERAYLVTLCMATLAFCSAPCCPGGPARGPGAPAARTSRAHAAPEPVAAD